MFSVLASVGLVAGMLAVSTPGVSAANASSLATDLDPLSPNSEAVDISEAGHIVGDHEISGEQHAFLWTQAGGIQDLGTLPGGSYSLATAVNNSGEVVGYSNTLSGFPHAFLWSPTTGMLDLGALATNGAGESKAQDIDDQGHVVGSSQTDTTFPCCYSSFHPFLWTQAGGMIDLAPTDPAPGFANAVNAGRVVGSIETSGARPFIWENAATGREFIDTPGYARGVGLDVNAAGQVLGGMFNSDIHGFLLTPPSTLIDLGRFDDGTIHMNDSGMVVGADGGRVVAWTAASGRTTIGPPASQSYAMDINASGDVIANLLLQPNAQSYQSYATVLSMSGPPLDLGTLGGEYSRGLAINDAGQVVGWSEVGNGHSHATLWQLPAPGIGITGVTPVANSVGRYEQFESSFDLDRSYTNPFDPNEVRVDVTFTSPTGKVSVVPGFWYQDFTASTDGNGNEGYTPVGGAGWRVRFAPSETGTYTYTIDAHDATASGTAGPMTFTVTASSEHGFVRLDPSDGRYLRYDDGTPYLPRGHNAAFEDRPPFQGGLSVYRPLFDSFAAAHENWTRVWMTDFNRSAIEWSSSHWSGLYEGVGVYSLASAWRWDKLLDRAAADGLEVQMVFNDHGQFSSPGSNQRWDENPYNAANGGPVPSGHPEQFFTNQAAKDLYKQRLRYIVARWGAYPDVLAWELFNELQFLGSAGSNPLNDPQMAADVQAWHIEMAAYLKSIDPFQHLVTTSSDAPGLTDPIWSDPNFDLVQVHDYGGPPMSRFAQTIENLRNTYDKPVIYGEFGLPGSPELGPQFSGFDPATFAGSTEDRHHLEQATHLRNAVWAAALSGSGAMSWWWGVYIASDPSHHRTAPGFPANEQIFPALDAYIRDVDIVGLGLHASQLTPNGGLFAVGMNNASRAFAWIQDIDSEYGSGVDPANATVSGGTLEIAGMQNGDYTADVYATSSPGGVVASFATSAIGGTLHLALPNFVGDIAVKVRPGPPQRPTNVVAAGGDLRAAVTWVLPTPSPPGSITSYSVIPRDVTLALDLAPVTATGTDVIVDGLTNGHNYTFTVIASNAVGAGPASAPSNQVTPALGAAPPSAISGSTSGATGGAVTTDTGSGPTVTDPLTTSVAVPPGSGDGTVSIAEGTLTQTAPSGYQFLTTQINIVSTAATTTANPLRITFTIDGSQLNGETPQTLQVFRTEGTIAATLVPDCVADPTTIAAPDPCIPVSSRVYVNGTDAQFTVVTSSASTWNLAPLPATTISVGDKGYAPKTAQAIQAQRVQWTFSSTKTHSATDAIGLARNGAPLFDSGRKTTGTYTYRFLTAGTYPYRSSTLGDFSTSFVGSIGVPMRTSKASTHVGTAIILTWSSASSTGYASDVQYRFKAAGSSKWGAWTTWQKGTATSSAGFTPTKVGTYDFHSRLRNTSTGRESFYSPDLLITVT